MRDEIGAMDNAKELPSDRELRGRVICRIHVIVIGQLLAVYTAIRVGWEEGLGIK